MDIKQGLELQQLLAMIESLETLPHEEELPHSEAVNQLQVATEEFLLRRIGPVVGQGKDKRFRLRENIVRLKSLDPAADEWHTELRYIKKDLCELDVMEPL